MVGWLWMGVAGDLCDRCWSRRARVLGPQYRDGPLSFWTRAERELLLRDKMRVRLCSAGSIFSLHIWASGLGYVNCIPNRVHTSSLYHIIGQAFPAPTGQKQWAVPSKLFASKLQLQSLTLTKFGAKGVKLTYNPLAHPLALKLWAA